MWNCDGLIILKDLYSIDLELNSNRVKLNYIIGRYHNGCTICYNHLHIFPKQIRTGAQCGYFPPDYCLNCIFL